MKRILLLLIFIIPFSSFALEEKVPTGYIYMGFMPKVNQAKSALKRIIVSNKYAQLEQMLAFGSRRAIGFDLVNQPISRLGISKNSYIEVMISPKRNDFMIKFSKGNPSILLRKFQDLLKKHWRSIKTSKRNGVFYFTTNNPRYSSKRLYYKVNRSSLVLANSLRVLSKQVSFKVMSSALHKKAESFIQKKKPLIYMFISKELFSLANRALAPLVNDSFVFFGSNSNSIWVSAMMQKKGFKEISLPAFIRNYPIFLLNTPIGQKDIQNIKKTLRRKGLARALGGIDIGKILGDQMFFTLEDFNFMELMQGIYNNISAGFGLKLRKSDVIVGIFEMALMQLRNNYAKGRKSVYRGAPLYIFENMPTSAGSKAFINLYCLIFKDYLFVHTKLSELKAMADRYKNGRKSLRLPVRSKSVMLYTDFIEFFKRLPIVKNRLEAYGLDVGNLNYLEAHYKVLSSFIVHGTMVLKFKN